MVGLYFDQMAKGRLGKVTPLRKHDMLRDFYEHFCKVHETVRAAHVADHELVAKFLAEMDAVSPRSGELDVALSALKKHHEARRESLSIA